MKKTILTVCAITTVGALGWIASSSTDTSTQIPDKEPTRAPVIQTAQKTTPSHNATSCSFAQGELASWNMTGKEVASLSPAAFGLPTGNSKPSEVATTLEATLHTEVLETSEDVTLLLGHWGTFESSALKRDDLVTKPFLFQVGPDCSIQGYAHHNMLPLPYARIQQALLHDLSFHASTSDKATFQGTDTLGALTGFVTHKKVEGVTHFTKTTQTLEPWSTGLAKIKSVDSATLVTTLAQDGWFQDATLNASYSGTGIEATRSLHVKRIKEHKGTDTDARDTSQYVWADLLPQDLPMDEGQSITNANQNAQDAVRDKSTDEIVDRLTARVQNPNLGIHQTWPEMRDYLEARPKAAHEVVEKLQKREIPSEATMHAYIALGNARTLEAKAALDGILRDETAPTFERMRAMFAMIERKDTGEDLAEYLVLKSQPLTRSQNASEHRLARHSLLALGVMSARKPKLPAIKTMAVRTVGQALADSTSGVMASPAYGAIANIGDPALLSHVADIADHPDYSTREAAAIVTRRMPPAETAAFTLAWLEKERDWRVKHTLYSILEQQTFSTKKMTSRRVLDIVLRDLKERPGPLTRKAMVRLLGRAIKDLPKEDAFRKETENVFAWLIPYELKHRTGLYRTITKHVNPRRLRHVLANPVVRDSYHNTVLTPGTRPKTGPQRSHP